MSVFKRRQKILDLLYEQIDRFAGEQDLDILEPIAVSNMFADLIDFVKCAHCLNPIETRAGFRESLGLPKLSLTRMITGFSLEATVGLYQTVSEYKSALLAKGIDYGVVEHLEDWFMDSELCQEKSQVIFGKINPYQLGLGLNGEIVLCEDVRKLAVSLGFKICQSSDLLAFSLQYPKTKESLIMLTDPPVRFQGKQSSLGYSQYWLLFPDDKDSNQCFDIDNDWVAVPDFDFIFRIERPVS